MKTIRQKYHVHSSPQEVWKALTDPKYIDDWGGGPAKMDDKEETRFELWGGDIYEKNIELEGLLFRTAQRTSRRSRKRQSPTGLPVGE